MSARFRLVRLIIAAAGVVVVAGAGWWWWNLHRREAIREAAIPASSVFAAAPGELQRRVAAAETMARAGEKPLEGLAALSRLYHANGADNEAMRCYAGLIQLEPREPRWPHRLAAILASYGRLEEAVPHLRRAIELAPDYLPARVRLGEALVKLNRAAEAVPVFEGALEREPGLSHALLGLARCDVSAGRWEAARRRLEAALQARPDFSGAITLLITVYEQLGDIDRANVLRARGIREYVDFADPWIDELVLDCHDPYRLSVAAAAAFLAGNTTRSGQLLLRAITLAPETGSYHRQLGKLHLRERNFAGARMHLEKAANLGPHDTEAWGLWIELLTTVGDAAGADRAIATGLANNPNSAAMHHANAGRLNRAGRFEEALAEYRRASELRPDDPRPHVDMAMLHFRREQIDAGIAALRQALAAEPGHPLPMGMLARHAILQGDEAEARRWIQQLRLIARIPPADLEVITNEYARRFGRAP